MRLGRWLSAGSAGSVVVGVLLCLGLVGAGVTRENPVGRVAGKVTMLENGIALPEAEIVLRPVVDTSVNNEKAKELGIPRYRYARTEDDGTFTISNVAAGKYKLEAYGQAHEMDPLDVEVVEGKTNQFNLVLKPRPPSLDLYAGQHVFQPNEKIKFDLHGFVEAEKVQMRVYRLRFEDVVREGTLYGALAPLAKRDGKAVDPATLGTLVTSKDEPVIGRDVEGTFRLNLSVDALREGLYWVSCTAGPLERGTYFSVTDMALVMKRAGSDVLGYATGLGTGQPVQGANVGYVRDGSYVSAGTTNREGVVKFRLPDDMPQRNTVLIARQGESCAFVDFYLNKRRGDQTRIYIYTDRPVYRPGDEVFYKGIVRNLVGSEYRIPAPGPVGIKVEDADRNLIDTKTLQMSANGTFSGSFTSNEESAPGNFSIEASFNESEETADVAIAAYRKPNYTVKVRPEKEHYIRGEKIRMIVECEYYFGGPVGGAKIEGSVSVAPKWNYFDPENEYDYESEGGYGGEWFTDVEGVTDSSGKAVLTFDSRLKDETKESWSDMEFTLTASVADEAGAYFEGSGSVTVSQGDFSLLSESSHYVVEKGQQFDVTFTTTDPVTEKPVAGKRIKVVAGYEFWDGLTTNFKPFAEKSLITASDGKAAVVITPMKGGSVVVKASSEDEHGNEMRSETHVWCSSSGNSYEFHEDQDLSIRLDKKQYDPGEKAKLLIQAKKPGASALVTIEGERIYSSRVVELQGNSTTVDISVEAAHAPNVFVNVCYVQDKQFKSRQRRLSVDLSRRVLTVDVRSDRETYLPGETATYTIQTKDEKGRPAPCELSLSVVDEAIYAIRDEKTDLVDGFYPKRYNEVETQYSFTSLYLDGGDKSPPQMEIRKKFKDTAFWAPSVQTDAQGKAIVRVPLPDNLTTWRATVQAVSRTTAVGTDVSKAIARKPLMVRLQTPAFYVSGDTQRLSASITNQTGRDADVNVELTLSGATAGSAMRQTVRLRSGETKAAEWMLTVGDPGEAVYTARAWIDAQTTDGVEGRVPIKALGRTEQKFESGDVLQSTSVKIDVDPNADRVTGGVVLSLSPSLAAPLFQSLDDLIDFPYGCVEQTMSRFMPAAVAAKVAQDLGLPKPRQSSKLPEIAADSYSRLGQMQDYMGGWGWWEYGGGDRFMTAYVLEGIHRARQAGYPNHSVDLPKALEWAEKQVKEPLATFQKEHEWGRMQDLDGRAYLAYVLALHGKTAAVTPALKLLENQNMSAQGYAFQVMAYNLLGADFVARRNNALARMKGLSKMSGRVVYWEEKYWGVESTARCLQALVAAEPFSTLIPMAIRHMMLARRGYIWSSTRDTAIGLLAIADYLKATNAQFSDATIDISVNGRPFQKVAFTKESIAEASKRIEIPMKLLQRGENTIEIRKSGAGTCYYSAELTQTVQDPTPRAFSNLPGVSIERSYHRLEQERLETGRMQLVPSKNAVTRFEPGELVLCVVKVTVNQPMRYLQIEDPMPSNCRIVEKDDLDYGDDWSYWWQSLVIRDDRIAYFAEYVEKGTFDIEYTLRAEQAGVSNSLPASVCEMYEPAKRAWTAVNRLEVVK